MAGKAKAPAVTIAAITISIAIFEIPARWRVRVVDMVHPLREERENNKKNRLQCKFVKRGVSIIKRTNTISFTPKGLHPKAQGRAAHPGLRETPPSSYPEGVESAGDPTPSW